MLWVRHLHIKENQEHPDENDLKMVCEYAKNIIAEIDKS